MPLAGFEPLSISPCPRCGFRNFIPRRLGAFVLFEPVGAGTNASAYKAWREDQGNGLFVVKLLHHDTPVDERDADALLKEGEIHARIAHHAHLPDYGGHGYEDGEHYYAAEYIAGERLKHRLAHRGRLPQKEALAIGCDLLSALQHIFECGYLYRDVNVGNVILRPDGRAVLVDFGLTESVEAAARKKREAYAEGAAGFIPPERILMTGENLSSIVYSLGMLLYLLLTGEDFVKASSLVDAAMRHVKPRLAVTASQMPGCSESVAALIARLTKQDPAQRFQTFEEARQAMAGVLAQLSR
jgi:serine/threonine protein kinase